MTTSVVIVRQNPGLPVMVSLQESAVVIGQRLYQEHLNRYDSYLKELKSRIIQEIMQKIQKEIEKTAETISRNIVIIDKGENHDEEYMSMFTRVTTKIFKQWEMLCIGMQKDIQYYVLRVNRSESSQILTNSTNPVERYFAVHVAKLDEKMESLGKQIEHRILTEIQKTFAPFDSEQNPKSRSKSFVVMELSTSEHDDEDFMHTLKRTMKNTFCEWEWTISERCVTFHLRKCDIPSGFDDEDNDEDEDEEDQKAYPSGFNDDDAEDDDDDDDSDEAHDDV